MGSSTYSSSDYAARTSVRSSTARSKGITVDHATFTYDADIKDGKVTAGVHKDMEPHGANRECRDSVAHPVSVPIAVLLDTTGSMSNVPKLIQSKLSGLMGAFLDDKASGKKYLGEGYPAIMVSAVDDFDAQTQSGYAKGSGALQVGQFESGIEIDDNLTKLWFTQNGGGTYSESYELGIYFMARHTQHDHWDKRGRKGYLFIIGDEHCYPQVDRGQVKTVMGDSIQASIPTEQIIAEAQERYNVFFILPNMTSHYNDRNLFDYWVGLLGQQNVLKLSDPQKICELIVGAVAICEENIGVDELTGDLGMDVSALVPLAAVSGSVERYSAAGLPAIAGGGETERL